VIDHSDPERRPVGIRVLESQPDLLQGLDDEQAALARRHVVAVLDTIEQGPWSPAEAYEESPGAIGLLLIDGVVARDLRIAGRWCSELLGPGDLLRPWDHDEGAAASLASDSAWTVLQQTRVAVLDERFARVACRWPPLMAGLVSRTLRRSRWMAIMLAISNLTRVDERVVAVMWHLADRWGHVTAEGVVLPVPLTHEMIGKLVGAHRPSVTSALGELSRGGIVERHEGGWLLHGEPPERMRGDTAAPVRPRAPRRLAIDPTLVAALPGVAAGVLS
jgi:CRP/FNR family transcriptional regulator, cyclic AMP receptor protein